LTSNGTLADVFATLDAIGVDIGNTRLSLWSALVVFVVLLAIFLFARLGSKLAKKVFARLTRLDPAQQLLGEKLVSVGVWALAILIGIDVLGVDLTALAVFSGAFGLAIGFGLQRTFGNLIAGIILLMDKSIKPGDVIAVSDTSGRESVGQIRKIGIRAISVVTRDRKEYLIPNENLMVNQVENWSYSSRDVRVKAPVGVSYDTDLAVAESLMLQAARGVDRVLENPEPKALLMAFGDSAVQFEIRFWISDPEEGLSNVRSDVLKQVWRLFRENGISIPFPQRDLHIKDWPNPPDLAG
jgi:small-conductance mechanosensitive channel